MQTMVRRIIGLPFLFFLDEPQQAQTYTTVSAAAKDGV
jgi:hypothetical protein